MYISKPGLEEEWQNSPSPSPPSWDIFPVPPPCCYRKHNVIWCRNFAEGRLHSLILLVYVPCRRTESRCPVRTCCSHFEVGNTITNTKQRKQTCPVHLNANRLQATELGASHEISPNLLSPCPLSFIFLSNLSLIIGRKMYQSRRWTLSNSCPCLLSFCVFLLLSPIEIIYP